MSTVKSIFDKQARGAGQVVKVGLVGAGKFGNFHATKINALASADLFSIYDRDEQAARVMAEKFGARHARSLEAMLSEVEAVIITSPALNHAQIAVAALMSGCHVFVEKPIALTLADADHIIMLARKNRLILQVGHQERFVAEALGLFDLPEVPLEIECRRCMPATGRGEDVSVVMDLMIHDLDLLGQYTKTAQPMITLDPDYLNNDHQVKCLFSFADIPLKASCVVSRRDDGRDRSICLKFPSGSIYLDFLSRQIRNTTGFALRTDLQTNIEHTPAISDPLAYGAELFMRAICENTKPAITGEEARRALSWGLQVEACLLQNKFDASSGSNVDTKTVVRS